MRQSKPLLSCQKLQVMWVSYSTRLMNAQRMLDIILTSLRYFAHQGLAQQGDTNNESNLIRLLHLRAEDNLLLLNWLQKPANKYTSPENQNEMLMIIALRRSWSPSTLNLASPSWLMKQLTSLARNSHCHLMGGR